MSFRNLWARLESPKKARRAFEQVLGARSLPLKGLTPEAGLRAAMDFYREARFATAAHGDADMLLFQWGTYDWGNGAHFELDVTRQLIWPSSGDDEMWQLSLTFRFAPTEALRALGAGNRWCTGTSDLPDFEAYARSTPAFREVAARSDGNVSLQFGSAE